MVGDFMNNVKVIYKGTEYFYPAGTTVLEISKKFQEDFKYPILLGMVNKMTVSLNYEINENCTLSFFDMSSNKGNKVYERTLVFVLIKAVKDILNKDVRIEHSIDQGIYCEIKDLNKEDLEKIKVRMNEIISKNYPIEKLNVNRLEMIEYYNNIGSVDNANLLKYLSNTYITIYKLDDIYDYMYGEMAISTSYVTDFDIEYISGDGFVLMMPFMYDDLKINSYTHHEKFFDSIIDYIKWSDRIGIRNFADLNKKLSDGKWDELIFMSEATYNKALLDISDMLLDRKEIKLILIAGPSSSGKTTTSKKLELFLEGNGLKPLAISVDDYFKERDETPVDENGHKDYDSINAIDSELFNKQLTELIEGKEVTIPTYNFITGKKEFKKTIKLKKDGILIIEGLHSLNNELTKSISDDKKFKIYISPLTGLNVDNHNRLSTTDNRLLRRMVRDNLRRGYNASDTLESWGRVRSAETKYVFPYQDEADMVLNTSLIYEISVLKVYAEPLLFSVDENDKNYSEALRLINMLRLILPMPSASIPLDSVMREFIGNGIFE